MMNAMNDIWTESLEFDAELHKYSKQGRPVPGVTEVLESVGISDFTFVDPDTLEYAKQLGTAVHRGCEFLDRNCLDRTSLGEAVRPYIAGWIKFKGDYDFVVMENELRVYDPTFSYAGTLDRIIKIGEKRVLVDIKSGEKTRAAPVQTAAYLRAFKYPTDGPGLMERWCIYLDNEGGYKRVIHRDYERDISVFLGALSVYVYNQNNK